MKKYRLVELAYYRLELGTGGRYFPYKEPKEKTAYGNTPFEAATNHYGVAPALSFRGPDFVQYENRNTRFRIYY